MKRATIAAATQVFAHVYIEAGALEPALYAAMRMFAVLVRKPPAAFQILPRAIWVTREVDTPKAVAMSLHRMPLARCSRILATSAADNLRFRGECAKVLLPCACSSAG